MNWREMGEEKEENENGETEKGEMIVSPIARASKKPSVSSLSRRVWSDARNALALLYFLLSSPAVAQAGYTKSEVEELCILKNINNKKHAELNYCASTVTTVIPTNEIPIPFNFGNFFYFERRNTVRFVTALQIPVPITPNILEH